MATRKKVNESTFKVGDILVGTGGYNRTYTKWYKVVRTTACKVIVDELPVSYPTKYGPNTPGDICMPVLDGHVDPSCPYYFGDFGLDVSVGGLVYETKYGPDYVKLPGDYGMHLHHWDGKPGWVNCD